MSSTLPVGGKSKRISVKEIQDEENSGDEDDSLYNLLSFEPPAIIVESTGNISSCTDNSARKTINGHAISKTMATTHVMGDSSFPSYTSLAVPFSYIQEGSTVSKPPPAFENMLSLGTSTFFSPGESSGLVRAGHEKVNEYSESEPHAGAACQPPIMFNS